MPKPKPVQVGEVKRRGPGGWMGHPNSIASVLRHQVQLQYQRKCARCRDIAMRDSRYCRMHAGRWAKRSDGPGRAERRLLCRMEIAGLLPLELLALPVWRNLCGLPTAQRAPARLALVQAWDKQDSSALLWAQAQRRALELGAQPGKRQNTAFWYENL
jgi:hypothetical protein